ncbi:MAG: SDR family oxidoreductase [Rhodospirillales bacterium]
MMTGPLAPGRLFCFGLGYSAERLARALMADGWSVAGTCRESARQEALAAEGIEAILFAGDEPMTDAAAALAGATHLLSSVPPSAECDPVLRHHGADIGAHSALRWAGYLSTTGVYGDTGGDWVDETSLRNPTSARSRERAAAEDGWLALASDQGVPVHVFRLAGIYGPGRSVLDQVRAGRARRIEKPGHLFSRIHVDDIATVLMASMVRPRAGAVYNVCDDEPAAAPDVTLFACELLGADPPPTVPFEAVAGEMSDMALSFWRDNRRVSNRLIKEELGAELAYPDYRAGLQAVLAAGG